VTGFRAVVGSSLGYILIIAGLTLREAARRRLLWVLVGLTAVIVVLTWWAFGRIAEASPVTGPTQVLGISQVTVMLAFMFSFVLAMTAVFAGSPAIGADIESGLLLAVLARPIRRAEVLLGRWLGLAIVLVAYALVAGYLELGAVVLATGYIPKEPALGPIYLAGESLVLLTLAIVVSTRISSVAGGAVAVVAFGLAWMAGILGGVGNAFSNHLLHDVGFVAKLVLPSDILWRGAAGALSPADDILTAGGVNAALYKFSPFSGASPSPISLVWCVVWVVGMLALGILLLRRREL
jgi:ABC-type transport system involved in multi-copper enzyme maturation permease subunit